MPSDWLARVENPAPDLLDAAEQAGTWVQFTYTDGLRYVMTFQGLSRVLPFERIDAATLARMSALFRESQ